MVVGALRHYEGGGESNDKLIEKTGNRCKIDEALVKIENWRGRKSKKIGVWRCLGGSWRVLGRLRGAVVRFWKTFLETLGRRWAQHGPSWSQVGSKLRPRWAMLAPRWPCWAQFGRLWLNFGSIFGAFLQMRWISKNIEKP